MDLVKGIQGGQTLVHLAQWLHSIPSVSARRNPSSSTLACESPRHKSPQKTVSAYHLRNFALCAVASDCPYVSRQIEGNHLTVTSKVILHSIPRNWQRKVTPNEDSEVNRNEISVITGNEANNFYTTKAWLDSRWNRSRRNSWNRATDITRTSRKWHRSPHRQEISKVRNLAPKAKPTGEGGELIWQPWSH